MLVFNCDICNKQTTPDPPIEPIFEETFDINGNKIKVQKMSIMKRQDSMGNVTEVEIPAFKDLSPRTYFVRYTLGQETIQRDFCKECFDNLRNELIPLWDKLEQITPK